MLAQPSATTSGEVRPAKRTISFDESRRGAGPLRSQVDVVGFDLGIEGRGIHAQQPRGARLVPARLVERPANQIDFEAAHFVIEIYPAADINRPGARVATRSRPR